MFTLKASEKLSKLENKHNFLRERLAGTSHSILKVPEKRKGTFLSHAYHIYNWQNKATVSIHTLWSPVRAHERAV